MKKQLLGLILVLGMFQISMLAQETVKEAGMETEKPKIRFAGYDGILIAGYVDKGAYLNFTGPNISLTLKKSRLSLGMLPSLRFKEDKSTARNSLVTPNLGVGLTYTYKKIAFQIPLYYNAKTATKNGQWHIGVGIGLRLK